MGIEITLNVVAPEKTSVKREHIEFALPQGTFARVIVKSTKFPNIAQHLISNKGRLSFDLGTMIQIDDKQSKHFVVKHQGGKISPDSIAVSVADKPGIVFRGSVGLHYTFLLAELPAVAPDLAPAPCNTIEETLFRAQLEQDALDKRVDAVATTTAALRAQVSDLQTRAEAIGEEIRDGITDIDSYIDTEFKEVDLAISDSSAIIAEMTANGATHEEKVTFLKEQLRYERARRFSANAKLTILKEQLEREKLNASEQSKILTNARTALSDTKREAAEVEAIIDTMLNNPNRQTAVGAQFHNQIIVPNLTIMQEELNRGAIGIDQVKSVLQSLNDELDNAVATRYSSSLTSELSVDKPNEASGEAIAAIEQVDTEAGLEVVPVLLQESADGVKKTDFAPEGPNDVPPPLPAETEAKLQDLKEPSPTIVRKSPEVYVIATGIEIPETKSETKPAPVKLPGMHEVKPVTTSKCCTIL